MFEEFKQLGFTDKEVKVYLCLVMLGKSNVQQICQQTNIFRTSVYSVLSRLIEKRLVSRTMEEKSGRQVEHFTPNDPSVLFDHIRRQRVSLDDKETVARQLVSRIMPQLYPKVRYQSGSEHVTESLKDFFAEIASVAASKERNRLLIYQNHTFSAEYATSLLPLLTESSLPTQLLVAENSDCDDFAHLQHVNARNLPNKLAPLTTLFCYSHIALLVVCQPDSQPHYAFSIKDSTIAQDCQRLLLSLWDCVQNKHRSTSASS